MNVSNLLQELYVQLDPAVWLSGTTSVRGITEAKAYTATSFALRLIKEEEEEEGTRVYCDRKKKKGHANGTVVFLIVFNESALSMGRGGR